MKESQIVVIDSAHEDDYGNVLFTDKNEGEHKVGKKRGEAILHLVLDNEGKAVKLSYDSYKNHDYISNVELVSDELVAQAEKVAPEKPEKPKSRDEKIGEDIRTNMEWKDQQIRRNFWWSQLGQWLLKKEDDKGADPFWKSMRSAYFAEMFSALDITIEKEGE